MTRSLLAAVLLVVLAARAAAQPLVADLSDHLISIRTDFAGTEVLLFGATEGDGEVIVVMRGPELPVTVRRKEQVAGIWINRQDARFTGVPAFYRAASSKPLAEIAAPAVLAREQIGLPNLRFAPAEPLDAAALAEFRSALIRNQERDGRFVAEVGKVSFLGSRLFRTRIVLPANVPTGAYTVEVFLMQDGQVAAAQATPMFVSRAGMSAEVFEFAHRQGALYGILAVLIAVLTGWAAAHLVRRA